MSDLRFYSASGAVKWAVEAAQRPGVVSSTQVVIRGLAEQVGDRSLTRDDILDTALSILARVNRIEPETPRLAFKSVLSPGEEERDQFVVSSLAATCRDEFGGDYSRYARLAHVALLQRRADEQLAETVPRAWFAHALGIRRQSLQAWEPVIKRMEQLIDEWVGQAKRQAKLLLDDAGLLRDQD